MRDRFGFKYRTLEPKDFNVDWTRPQIDWFGISLGDTEKTSNDPTIWNRYKNVIIDNEDWGSIEESRYKNINILLPGVSRDMIDVVQLGDILKVTILENNLNKRVNFKSHFLSELLRTEYEFDLQNRYKIEQAEIKDGVLRIITKEYNPQEIKPKKITITAK